jgi:hypothetical protein
LGVVFSAAAKVSDGSAIVRNTEDVGHPLLDFCRRESQGLSVTQRIVFIPVLALATVLTVVRVPAVMLPSAQHLQLLLPRIMISLET